MADERLEFGTDGMTYQAMLAAQHVSRYYFVRSLCAGKRVLDIACGEGYGSRLLAEWGAKEVIGVDISQDAIRKANTYFATPNVQFVLADACDLGQAFLSNERFEVICSFETIEHVEDVESFLRNVRQLRTNDSSVVISCPNDSILPADFSNPFHRSVFTLDTFKSETENSLGKAAAWYLGTPFQGYTVSPENGAADGDGQGMDLALTGSEGGDLWLLPPQQNIRPRPDNVDFFIGLWGRDVLPRACVGSPLSQSGFVETWQSLEALRPELAAVRADLGISSAALVQRNAELRTASTALERRTADLRRTETVLAEERRAAMNFRARADGLYDLKPLIKEIAKEVWWEKNRRGLAYKAGKLIKRFTRRS